jgi:hypothetical protein
MLCLGYCRSCSIEVNYSYFERIKVKHNVIRLQVSVNVPYRMKLSHSFNGLKKNCNKVFWISSTSQIASEVYLMDWKLESYVINSHVSSLVMNNIW